MPRKHQWIARGVILLFFALSFFVPYYFFISTGTTVQHAEVQEYYCGGVPCPPTKERVNLTFEVENIENNSGG